MRAGAKGGLEPDPRSAAGQAEFRRCLEQLMRFAGYKSLQQLEASATRRGVTMPVSTASRALTAEKLPTAEFVKRFVTACDGDVKYWLEARELVLDKASVCGPAIVEQRESVDACPYPGLAAYEQRHAQWFFGRKRMVAELLGQLAGDGPVIVAGPSGAGKSSLLRAGLVPALDEGRLPGSRNWSRTVFTPTAHPRTELAKADRSGPRTVLIVDQFEEIFTLCGDEQERRTFIGELCSGPPVLAVIGLRADFYDQCMAYPELIDAFRHGLVPLGAMCPAEIRDAIEKPAHAVGMSVERGLADRMIEELGAQPGALPLLSHSLFATWQQREGNLLTVDGYQLTGGIRGAIAATAERVYLRFDADGRKTVQRLLLRMVAIGDGTPDTRRRLTRAHFADGPSEGAMLAALAEARLITVDAETVEIIHEALLRAWPRLRDWIDNDRARLLACQRLTEAAAEWDREGRHRSGLYQGPRLAAVREWGDVDEADLSTLARQFLAESGQCEHEQQLAARRRTRRLRQLVACLAGLLVVAVTGTVVAVLAREQAVQERNIGISRRVAADAVALRTVDPGLAAQLSLVAFKIAETGEARGGLFSALSNHDPRRLSGDDSTDAIRSVAFSSDGLLLAAGGHDKTVRIFDATDPFHSKQFPALRGHTEAVRSVAFSPDNRVLATGSHDRTVRLWDIATGSSVQLTRHAKEVWGVAFSHAGDKLATASLDGSTQLWDISDAGEPILLATLQHAKPVTAVAFSPDGTMLATTSDEQITRLWAISVPKDAKPLTTLGGYTGSIFAVSFNRQGTLLATGSADATVRLWDVRDTKHVVQTQILSGHTSPVYGVAFSHDGHYLASASVDTTARLWDVSDPYRPSLWAAPLAGHNDNVYSVSFAPDGYTLATASHDRSVGWWDLDENRVAAQICRTRKTGISPEQWQQYLPDIEPFEPCPR